MAHFKGRPTENSEVLDKWEITSTSYDKETTTIKFDRSKNPNGPYMIEKSFLKSDEPPTPKIDQKMYSQQPTVMVFKTSNRSNAQTKMKIFSKNIDYILSAKKLPGVPEKVVVLDLGVGKSMIKAYKLKYNIN
jgi:hypothetical protein